MGQGERKYEKEYKVQAVKLVKEIGAGKAAQELSIPVDTLYGWQKAVREGRLDAGPGSRTPETAMSLAEEPAALRKQVKELEKANRRPSSIQQYGIRQSMNGDDGRCHDNARCETMWVRMKNELFYDRLDPERLTVEELKTLVWRYFMSC